MQITPKTLHLMQQVLRCIVYVGIAHSAFEVMTIWQSPEISHLWYFGLAVPGLYYLVPAIVLTIVIAVASKK